MTENPHHALSSTDGRFEIRDVPPGTWTLRIWHEVLGERRIEIHVLSGGTADLGALHFP